MSGPPRLLLPAGLCIGACIVLYGGSQARPQFVQEVLKMTEASYARQDHLHSTDDEMLASQIKRMVGASSRFSAVMSEAQAEADALGKLDLPASLPIRGVNLGSWLLPERWITPHLFEGTNATDLYRLSRELGKRAMTARMDLHRETWITEADFIWLKSHGVNAVRLPLGYWDVVDRTPFGSPMDPFPSGGSKYVQRCLDWAAKHRIKVLLDLHGAPGSQNGEQHSGRAGPLEWYDWLNVEHTLMIIEELVRRWGNHYALWGIELMNEPAVPPFVNRRTGHLAALPSPTTEYIFASLRSYYKQGYEIVRKHCATVFVAFQIGVPDGNISYWRDFMVEPEYKRVLLDLHFYHAFLPHDKKLSFNGHLAELAEQAKLYHAVSAERRLMIGEWSAVLPPRGLCTAELDNTTQCPPNATLSPAELDARKREWLEHEIEMIKHAPFYASFFWTYKKEDRDTTWSFRTLVGDGIWPTVKSSPEEVASPAVEATASTAEIPAPEVHVTPPTVEGTAPTAEIKISVHA